MFQTTLISWFITLHYTNERMYLEAFLMSQHTLTEVENVMDFISKNNVSDKRNQIDFEYL